VRRRRGAWVVGVALVASSLTIAFGSSAGAAPGQVVFTDPTLNGTGGQAFVVPAGVCDVNIVALGAAGGTGRGDPSDGRNGGTATATIPVTPGETLHVFVGGKGSDFVPAGPGHGFFGGLGGLNGGGDAGNADQSGVSPANPGGGGGGASDVRQGGPGLGDRVVVAGGGGGGGGTGLSLDARGGTGGGTKGDPGLGSQGGGGGTQSIPGGGTGGASPGGAGVGGAGATGNQSSGGGGGGGYFGGGGGGTALIEIPTAPFFQQVGSGGGGGSGFTLDGTGLTLGGGPSASDGQVTITPGTATCPSGGGNAATSVEVAPRFTG
jgi:hypothetical protein